MSFGDTPREHIYTNQTHPYFRSPHIYLAVAARFLPGRQVLSAEEAGRVNVNPNYFKDCSDAVLMTSRGGNIYDRTFMEGFIRPGIGLQFLLRVKVIGDHLVIQPDLYRIQIKKMPLVHGEKDRELGIGGEK